MSDKSGRDKADAERQQRLSAALRANLKRRKQQAKGRSAENAPDRPDGPEPARETTPRGRTEP